MFLFQIIVLAACTPPLPGGQYNITVTSIIFEFLILGGMILLGAFIAPTSQNPCWISSLKLAFCTPANQLLQDEIS